MAGLTPIGGPSPTPSEQPQDVQANLKAALGTFISTFRESRPDPASMASAIITLQHCAQAARKQ